MAAGSTTISRGLRRSLTVFTFAVLVFIYVPLALVLVNSFNTDNTFGWPPPGYTLEWWRLAFQNGFRTILGIDLSLWTIVIAHATFCIVTVFNNAIARLRRLGGNLEEASMDLGAGTFRTFWSVTLPMMRSALLAGALLSFALSFDEIIVTTFTAGSGVTTLPIFILNNMFRPNQAPIVSVIAVVLVLVSIIPIYIAQRLSGSEQQRR